MFRSGGVSLAIACAVASVASADPVRGRVVDRRGVPVRGAAIAIENSALTTTTDDAGWFSLDDVPASAGLIISKDGYAVAFAIASEALPDVVLQPEGEGGETITVHGEMPPTTQGTQRFARDDLQHLPGTGGDLIQSLSAMPGVATTEIPLGTSGIVIRGSSPQDSKFLVDDFEVPALYHDLGFRSIVREEAIDSLDYIPGGFDAAFGRATSGVVSVTTRAGDDSPRGELDTSTGEVGLLVQGHAGNLRYMVAVRRSLIDLLVPLLLPDDLDVAFPTFPRFYDEQLRIDYKLSPHWDVRVSSLGSDDALAIYGDKAQSPDQYFSDRTRFIRGTAAALYHDGPWSAKLALSAIAVEQDADIGVAQHVHVSSPAITVRGEAQRLVDELGPLRQITWRVGAEAVHTRNEIDVAAPQEQREGETAPPSDPNDTSLSFRGHTITDDLAAWTVASAQPRPWLVLTAGLRVDDFRRNHDVAIQPRGDLAVRVAPQLTVRISVGAYSRPPEYQSELLAPNLHAERSIQRIVGAVWEPLDGVRIQPSVYINDRSDLITREMSGALANDGTGTTSGAELAASVRRGPWFGWLAYSYSHSTRVDQPGEASRLFDYDQPHNLELLGSYRIG
ncbi:MAG TPA: TonB-dependent receptor, partial [Kofleriaceae bacterium]|nr:TonB-dependent receptor [Kofleriaceae bacterium]